MSILAYLYLCMVNYLFGVAPECFEWRSEVFITLLVWRGPRAFGWRPKLRYDSCGAAPECFEWRPEIFMTCLFGAAPERSGDGLSFTMTRVAQPPSVSSGGLRFLLFDYANNKGRDVFP